MFSAFVIFLSIWLFTLITSFLPECFLKPQPPISPLVQKPSVILLHCSCVSILFLSVTLIVQRPIFSFLAVFIFLTILNVVSNAKLKALREPLVTSDIAMFSQAFKHPRLYFPFIGVVPLVLLPLIIVGLIITVLTLEPAMSFSWFRILVTIGMVFCFYLLAKKIAMQYYLKQDPATDNRQFGLVNTLFIYFIQARSEEHKQKIQTSLHQSPFTTKVDEPNSEPKKQHITVIQSESFFDARRLHPSIKSDVLDNYDHCLSKSELFGKLSVPAWGANTMRTEFSFLTGLQSDDLGLYRFYPYHYLHKKPIVSIASYLRTQGYYCVCIHPHPASFFGRDRIFPQMGFDEFIDNKQFNEAPTFGPYISDQAVTDKILAIQQQYADKKLFIFAITMENHGPLHLEKTTIEEQQNYYTEPPLNDSNDLTVYLRHLKNADIMVQQLTSAFKQSAFPQTLCFYGDHIPSMPNIYQKLSYEDRDSDYFIWNNGITNDKVATNKTNKPPTKKSLAIDKLAAILVGKT